MSDLSVHCSLTFAAAQARKAYLEFLQRALPATSKDAAIFARPDLSTQDFEIDTKPLGEGASGHVYRARPRGGDGVWYALKRFDQPQISNDTEANMARREMDKARVTQLKASGATGMNQRFIVRLFAVINDPDNKEIGKVLVYELCQGSVSEIVMRASNESKKVPVHLYWLVCIMFV